MERWRESRLVRKQGSANQLICILKLTSLLDKDCCELNQSVWVERIELNELVQRLHVVGHHYPHQRLQLGLVVGLGNQAVRSVEAHLHSERVPDHHWPVLVRLH